MRGSLLAESMFVAGQGVDPAVALVSTIVSARPAARVLPAAAPLLAE